MGGLVHRAKRIKEGGQKLKTIAAQLEPEKAIAAGQPTRRCQVNAAPFMSASCLAALSLFYGAGAAVGDEPKIPGIMLPELTKVTPEMIANITAACPKEPLAKPEKPRKLLVFSRCENFTHHSISVAERALTLLGEKTGAWSTEISYDYEVFEAKRLAAYDAIVLNNCQNMEFPAGAPREALLAFVRNGRGIVALHSAVDNFGSDDLGALRTMLGGCSAGHPWGHYLAWRFKVEEPNHPLTAHLNPDGFSMKDAMFQFDTRTGRQNVRVLVSMDMTDPTTAKDENGKQRGFRTDGLNPVVWVRPEGKGRVFVNCFGNNDEIFWSASMLRLNLAGIQYATGDLIADDAIVPAGTVKRAAVEPPQERVTAGPAAGDGLKACWWNNNSFSGEPVLTNQVTKLNPVVDSPTAPFPATTPPLGPEFVSARFTGTFIPKIPATINSSPMRTTMLRCGSTALKRSRGRVTPPRTVSPRTRSSSSKMCRWRSAWTTGRTSSATS